MMRVLAAILGCLWAQAAACEPSLARSDVPPSTLRANGEFSYQGYVAGLHVTDMRVGAALRPDGYQLGVEFHVVGLVGAVMQADNFAITDGLWRGNQVQPLRFNSGGQFRGAPRHMLIDYPAGQPRVIERVVSAKEPREEVPEALQRDTIDDLSAIAYLLRIVAATGGCDGHITMYDGLRASEVTSHTVGMEVLPLESRSSFAGTALRCDLEGRQIAGFPIDAGPDDMLRRVQHSSFWMASVLPGGPMVPVLMSIEVRLLGHMTIYLTQAQSSVQMANFTPTHP